MVQVKTGRFKPSIFSRKAREEERRDCPKYDKCLNKAALRNAVCVPCLGCRRNKK
jgi:hypothetical protein